MQDHIRQTTITLLLSLVVTLGAGLPSLVLADDKKRTRSEAVEIAKKKSKDGKVLGVKKIKKKNGDVVFDVKIISNGRVKVYSISEKP